MVSVTRVGSLIIWDKSFGFLPKAFQYSLMLPPALFCVSDLSYVFVANLSSELNSFEVTNSDVNEDFSSWYGIILKHLNQHAPYKTKRVKTSKLPDWYNDDIAQARKKRDDFKCRKLWADFKTYRNKTKQLIKIAKRKHFSDWPWAKNIKNNWANIITKHSCPHK